MAKEESIKEYYFRINKTIDFIKTHLDSELSLDKLADVSNLSKYHFHRIFKSVTGLTLNNYIKKARIERALFFLMNNPAKSMHEISIDCGFSSISTFSRSFREAKNMTPSDWKISYKNSKICKTNSNSSQPQETIENYLAFKLNKIKMNKEITIDFEIKELNEFHVAYIRNLTIHKHDSETFGKMFEQLFSWAAPRKLIKFPETKALTVYRSLADSSGMLQADVCLTVPETVTGEGLIGTTTISGGLYAIFHKEAPMSECFKTWTHIYENWFEENGYQPDNRNFFLNHLNDPKTHPQNFHIIDIYIPIKPL